MRCVPPRQALQPETLRENGTLLTGNAEAELVWVFGEETFEQSALAHAGGAGHEQGPEEVLEGRHGGRDKGMDIERRRAGGQYVDEDEDKENGGS